MPSTTVPLVSPILQFPLSSLLTPHPVSRLPYPPYTSPTFPITLPPLSPLNSPSRLLTLLSHLYLPYLQYPTYPSFTYQSRLLSPSPFSHFYPTTSTIRLLPFLTLRPDLGNIFRYYKFYMWLAIVRIKKRILQSTLTTTFVVLKKTSIAYLFRTREKRKRHKYTDNSVYTWESASKIQSTMYNIRKEKLFIHWGRQLHFTHLCMII